MFDLKYTLCRTCLGTITQSKGSNIFITDDLAKKLRSCTGQPVEPTDEHPHQLCQKCYESILKFYEFQQMCCKSLKTFLDLIKTTQKSERISSTSEQASDNLKEAALNEPSTEDVTNSHTFLKTLENGKKSSKLKNKVKDQKSEKIAVAERSISRLVQKNYKSGVSKGKTKNDLKEYLQFGKEDKVNENIEYSLVFQKPIENLDQINSVLEDVQVGQVINKEGEIAQRQLEEIFLVDAQECAGASALSFIEKNEQQCHCCSLKFKTRLRLQVHLRQQAGLPPYLCSFKECACSFDRWPSYQNHLKTHNRREKSFKCDMDNCEQVYKTKSNLNIHKRKFHNLGPKPKTHMCEICGKVFKSSGVLNEHHFTHIDKTQLPFACEEKDCSKRFYTKERLKIHKMRHAGIKNFVCPHCGMRKTTRTELKIHINYHTLEKTWPCRFCPKVCNSAGNLKMHTKNIHEGVKDFACRFCQRTFAKADTKKYHEMTHTGEKPNECKECGRRFAQPAALRNHRKIHLRQKEKLTEKQKGEAATIRAEEPSVSGNIDETNFITVEILNDVAES